MPISGNVKFTNTFDDWRDYTNKTITAYNVLETANLQFVTDTPSVLQINGITRGNSQLTSHATSNVITLTCNAYPTTANATLSGNVTINPLTGSFNIVANTNGLFIGANTQILVNGHIIIA